MDARAWFTEAATGLLDVLPGVPDRLEEHGLGEWSVRSLLGHTARAFLTVETYLEAGSTLPGPAVIGSAEGYFRAAAEGLADPAQVIERGRQAGLALGEDPVEAVREVVGRGLALVAATPDETLVGTPLGAMTLAAYLPTRAFEVSVHTLDLARACDQVPPAATLATLEECLALAVRIASAEQRLELILAVTGREPLRTGFCVL